MYTKFTLSLFGFSKYGSKPCCLLDKNWFIESKSKKGGSADGTFKKPQKLSHATSLKDKKIIKKEKNNGNKSFINLFFKENDTFAFY